METKKKGRNNPCYCINLRRSAFATTDYYDRILKPSGLTLTQYSLLKTINSMEGCSVTSLANSLKLERTTVVRNLKPLISNNYIEDKASKGKRNRKIYLTESGKNILAESHLLWEKAQNELEHIFGLDIMTLLSQILTHMGRLK